MIELLWKEVPKNHFEYITRLIAWLVSIVEERNKVEPLEISGYIVFRNHSNEICSLIIAEEQYQKKILNILQQPPDEYKEKYVACIPSKEPDPVNEKDYDDGNDESMDVT